MRPIDYAIELMAANSTDSDLFYDLVKSLYFEETSFIVAVSNCLKEHDPETLNRVDGIFYRMDCQL